MDDVSKSWEENVSVDVFKVWEENGESTDISKLGTGEEEIDISIVWE